MDDVERDFQIGAIVRITDDNRQCESKLPRPIEGRVIALFKNDDQHFLVVSASAEMFVCRAFDFPDVMISAMHGDLKNIT